MPRSRECGCAIWHAWAAAARLRPAEPASTVPALRRVGRSPMLAASASVRLDAQTHQLAPRSRRSHGITHLVLNRGHVQVVVRVHGPGVLELEMDLLLGVARARAVEILAVLHLRDLELGHGAGG